MSRATISLLILSLALFAALGATGCDAESAAVNLLSRQGLNLLRPARSYITPGGLFVKGHGIPEYIDAFKEVPPEPGNLIDFDAVVMEETKNNSFGIGFALDLAGKILASPIGLKYQQNQNVKLAQIQTTGTRLTTVAIDDNLLLKPSRTASEALAQLKRNNEVYLVQEIYLAKDLNLQADAGQELSLQYNNGSPIKSCDQAHTPDKPAAGTASDDASKKRDTANSTSRPAPAATSAGPTTPAVSKTAAAALPGGALSVCSSSKFETQFHTDKVLPFAVRLIKLRREGNAVRRDTAATIKGTLGPQGGVLAAGRVNESWEIQKVTHVKRQVR